MILNHFFLGFSRVSKMKNIRGVAPVIVKTKPGFTLFSLGPPLERVWGGKTELCPFQCERINKLTGKLGSPFPHYSCFVPDNNQGKMSLSCVETMKTLEYLGTPRIVCFLKYVTR